MAPTVVSAQDSTSQQQRPAPQAQEADSTPLASAQPATGRTHAVRTGDTLWDLSRTYLGDPFLWPEIYRLNTDVVEDPHWIYPGEQLHLPGQADGPTVAAGEPVTTSFGPTLFTTRSRSAGSSGRLSLIGRANAPVIRAGDYYAAPWVERTGGPSGNGRIIGSADITVAVQSGRDHLQIDDRVLLVPPAGESPLQGSRYLAYALGPELPGRGQVVVPTGIVVVESARANDQALHGRVVVTFDDVRVGQGLLRIDSVSFPTTRPAPVELGGVDAKVVWVRGENVLPSLHQYVVLDRSSHDGIKQGDQFTLLRRRRPTEEGVTLPSEPIAVVKVIRVTPFGSTAMVVEQRQPAIGEGNDAKMTAKMP